MDGTHACLTAERTVPRNLMMRGVVWLRSYPRDRWEGKSRPGVQREIIDGRARRLQGSRFKRQAGQAFAVIIFPLSAAEAFARASALSRAISLTLLVCKRAAP